ncbi:MAG: hypothetical protein H7839_10320 [Magnetococcus sp. YQC-5]
MRNIICHCRLPAPIKPNPLADILWSKRTASQASKPHERPALLYSRSVWPLRWLLAFSVFWVTLFGCWVAPVWAEFSLWPVRFKAAASPWRVWGFLGIQLTDNMMRGKKATFDQVDTINVNINKNFTGYLWKPWVLQWNTSVNLGGTTTQRIVYLSQNDKDTGSETLTRSVNVGFDFTVLPESRFPLKVTYSRTSDDNSEGEGSFGQANLKEVFGLNQDYRNSEGDLRVVLRLDHNRDVMGSKNNYGMFGVSVPSIDRLKGKYSMNTVSLGISKQFEDQTADLFMKHSMAKSAMQGTSATNQEDSAMLNHALSGGKTWSVNSLSNYSRIQTATQTNQKEEAFFIAKQFGSSAFWRSEDVPLYLSGSTRVNTSSQQFSMLGGAPTKNRSASVVTGGNYQFSPEMTVNTSLNANYEENEAPTKFTVNQDATQTLSANYSPERIPLGAYMHNWYVSGTLTSHQAKKFRQNNTANNGVGQTLMRDVELDSQTALNVSLNQTAFSNHVSARKPLHGINHSLNGRIIRMDSDAKLLVDATLSDTRSLGDILNNTQALNMQFSAESPVSSGMSMQGHLTSQLNRTSSHGVVVTGYFSSADLMFQLRELFDVTGLSYTSKLQINVTSQFLPFGSLMGDYPKIENKSWWNFLDFGVGKLSARMTLGVTEIHTKDRPFERTGLFLFQLQRFFDTTFTQWSLPDVLLPPINKREKEDD